MLKQQSFLETSFIKKSVTPDLIKENCSFLEGCISLKRDLELQRNEEGKFSWFVHVENTLNLPTNHFVYDPKKEKFESKLYGYDFFETHIKAFKNKVFLSNMQLYEVYIDMDRIKIEIVDEYLFFTVNIGYRLFKNFYDKINDFLFFEINS